MKKERKMYIAAVAAFAVFILLVFACATTDNATTQKPKIGETLEETLGIQLKELENIFGMKQTEFEIFFGRRLRNNEILSTGNISINNFPKTGVTIFFQNHHNQGIDVISFSGFNGLNDFNTLVEQTISILGNATTEEVSSFTESIQYHWIDIDGNGFKISVNFLGTKLFKGEVYWNIVKITE